MRFAMQPAQTCFSAWCSATLVESALAKGQGPEDSPSILKPCTQGNCRPNVFVMALNASSILPHHLVVPICQNSPADPKQTRPQVSQSSRRYEIGKPKCQTGMPNSLRKGQVLTISCCCSTVPSMTSGTTAQCGCTSKGSTHS